jgi:hypothetical protein
MIDHRRGRLRRLTRRRPALSLRRHADAQRCSMKSIFDPDPAELTPDEIVAETYLTGGPIGVTFAGGTHESDLISFLERAKHLAGDVL